MASPGGPDLAAVTDRQREMWSAGDFNELARTIVPVAEALVVAADPLPGQAVLDVACGSGNVALVAARRHCRVTGVDYVPALIERARRRAAAEGSPIDFLVGDAQALPVPDAAFDVVTSVFGVMFAPDQPRAAAELLRVCRPGGTIALASWMPEGFAADLFAVVAARVPPPPGLAPAMRWGTKEGLAELLGGGAREIAAQRRAFDQYFLSPDHAVALMRAHLGPIIVAFAAVGPEGEKDLQAAVTDLIRRYDRGAGDGARIHAEYLEAVVTRSG